MCLNICGEFGCAIGSDILNTEGDAESNLGIVGYSGRYEGRDTALL